MSDYELDSSTAGAGSTSGLLLGTGGSFLGGETGTGYGVGSASFGADAGGISGQGVSTGWTPEDADGTGAGFWQLADGAGVQGDAAAGGGEAGRVAVLAARRYLYASGPVCYTCGEPGHEGPECETPFCEACSRYGHDTGCCRSACSTCGGHHDPPVGRKCRQSKCGVCELFGHPSADCPQEQCRYGMQ